VDVEDNTITLNEEKQAYKGSLVVVPTPIGNLGDLSLRQYEALTTCDIIACEDTRKTGKMLELIRQRRMKDKFKSQFGATIEDFFDEKEDDTPSATDASAGDKGGATVEMLLSEEGDEALLEKLLKANEAIDQISSTKQQGISQDELSRQ
jgi:16S rRNA C1402 (ribose-2'-O) methylase RsmI